MCQRTVFDFGNDARFAGEVTKMLRLNIWWLEVADTTLGVLMGCLMVAKGIRLAIPDAFAASVAPPLTVCDTTCRCDACRATPPCYDVRNIDKNLL